MWQLVDGRPEAVAPASRTHNTLQGELVRLIGDHLVERDKDRVIVPNAGEPVLLVEILSPTKKTYTTIPTVREILILHSVLSGPNCCGVTEKGTGRIARW